ncbi:hypothetical protein BS78_01G228400 [Paspalum vaginatum]|nr:hypothetical protein BS78_01G228400 [Paspalum vaginatum]
MLPPLREMKSFLFSGTHAKGVMLNLEDAIRTKVVVLTPQEEKMLRFAKIIPTAFFILGSTFGTFLGWFGTSLGDKLLRVPPTPRFVRFLMATGLHLSPEMILTMEGRMKMELANIILNQHSEDVYLSNLVRKNFFAEHLFDDLHQDQPLFRWHPRRSYTDSAFVERMKEIKASKSHDEARSISTETNAKIRPVGSLVEDDPLACILGSPGGTMETNKPTEKNSTVLKRSELRARRRAHRHHRRHACDKFAAF